MKLGTYEALRAMLNREFGTSFYTDDNDVVDGNDFDGKTVATLFAAGEGKLRIEYADERPSKVVEVAGSGF